ncbi:MAG: SMP-30/gluconolactonase/LRE family protein [Planctomycetes bacterium]|nr:SMP-30/gluconolactonase/LRE family protein [Planctomycetota bacterium]
MLRFLARRTGLVLAVSTTSLALLTGGCPTDVGDPIGGGTTDPGTGGTGATQPPANAAPTVNAGADQSVAGGSPVTLAATASDPEGGPLTYAWSQTAGTPVTLAGGTTATAAFSAAVRSETLTFSVLVTDAQGASATDTVSVVVTVEPVLFIANFAGGVTSYASPSTVNGNIAPDANLFGPATQLSSPADIVIDSKGALLVANFASNAITGYDDAATANGNLPPDRNVSGGSTLLAGPASLAIDADADLLFVANYTGAPDSIGVYSGASATALNGNLGPTRRFFNAAISNPAGINLDDNGSLYIANSGPNNVLVYAGAGALNGDVAPTRTISSPAFAGVTVFDVFVDKSDTLYALGTVGAQRIFVFDNASTLNGAVMPDVILTVTGAGSIRSVVVDSAGTGYITDSTTNAVYAYNNLAARNGTLPPDRTISGGNTQMASPIRLFLLER